MHDFKFICESCERPSIEEYPAKVCWRCIQKAWWKVWAVLVIVYAGYILVERYF